MLVCSFYISIENLYYFFLIIAIIIGAFWAIHSFIIQENKAGLSLHINEISHLEKKKGEYYLKINVNAKNISNRELDILLQKTNLKVFKISNNKQIDNIEITNKLIYEIVGRHTHKSYLNARMRSGVDYNFPYSIILKENGRYFIEFSIVTDMNKYKSKLAKIITKKVKDITWKDKTFYTIIN